MQIAREGSQEELDTVVSSEFWLSRLDTLDEKENSALHYAARYSHVQTVEKLIGTKRATVDIPGSDGMTPLHYASRSDLNIHNNCH